MFGIFSLMALGTSSAGHKSLRESQLDGFRTFNHSDSSAGSMGSPANALSGPPQDVFERST
jgi:hypothetical protein